MADPSQLVEGPEEEVPYHPIDAIKKTTQTGLTTGLAGLLLSTVQNSLQRTNVGALGAFTKFGSTTAWFAGAGASYAFVSAASGNLRQKEDMYNHLFGGFATGALIGLRRRAFPAVIGTGLFVGGTMAVLSYAGGLNFSTARMTAEERQEQKEEHRRRFRRPYQEMVNQIGEGRGIYPPGYEERRAQRIKENYGIEVQPPYYERKKAAGLETSAI